MDGEAGACGAIGDTAGAASAATNTGRSSSSCSNVGDTTTGAGEERPLMLHQWQVTLMPLGNP
jgi:hypothetical protein